jgi:predicted dehydrogenase
LGINDMKRFGLVGLGNQAKEHLIGAELTEGITIESGYDPSPTAQQEILKTYPDFRVAESLEQLLETEDLDGLILALPHHIYEAILPTLLEHRVPLLKEKPLARNIDEARAFVALAQQHDIPLVTAIQRRTHPSYITLKEQLSDKSIQHINLKMNLGFSRSSTDTWRDDRNKAGGGALLDAGYHMMDLALFLTGEFDLISSVIFKDGKPCPSDKIDDEAEITGRNGNTWINIQCRIFNDADAESPDGYPKSERIEVITNEGTYLADRTGVWFLKPEGIQECIFECNKQWQQAMSDQLLEFGRYIDRDLTVNINTLWDQHPAQCVIQQAYQQAFNMHSGVSFDGTK